MNYVRKLGFEENPDYDFLRDLFSKVLKTTGDQDDGVYDWMLLNNGKGWEAGHVSAIFSLYWTNLLINAQDTVTDPCSSARERWPTTDPTARAPRTQDAGAQARFATGVARRKPTHLS